MNPKLEGFAFPFRIDGGLARQKGFEKVAANVRHLLATRLGERVMLRNYGGGVHHRLQDSNDETLRTLVRHEVEQALRTWIPAARLTSPVEVTRQEHRMLIAFEYVASPKDVLQRMEIPLP